MIRRSNMEDKSLYNQLEKIISGLDVFDTHEHLMGEEERKTMDLDVFYLLAHYAGSDIISSGMPVREFEKLYDRSFDIEKRWGLFEPYLDNIKNSSYYKVILESVRDLLGVEDIDSSTYILLSEKLDSTKKENWYDFIIREKSNIKHIVNIIENIPEVKDRRPVKREEFIPVKNFEDIISVCCIEDIKKFEERYGINIYSLRDYIKMIDKVFDEDQKKGYRVLKILSAYFRSINFEEVTFGEADRVFSRLFLLKDYGFLEKVDFLSKDELKPLQDHLTHHIIQKAIEYSWPIQIHSGLLNGNRGDLLNTNPCLLINLFLKYTNAVFDIFHAGYPFSDELMTLSKQFPNVYFDLCWIHQVSSSLYEGILERAMEMIPINKIFAFGGDNSIIECTYGALKIAKRSITKVLYRKIKQDYFSFEQAEDVAKKILFSNPLAIYGSK
jgi:uncharacterized protein